MLALKKLILGLFFLTPSQALALDVDRVADIIRKGLSVYKFTDLYAVHSTHNATLVLQEKTQVTEVSLGADNSEFIQSLAATVNECLFLRFLAYGPLELSESTIEDQSLFVATEIFRTQRPRRFFRVEGEFLVDPEELSPIWTSQCALGLDESPEGNSMALFQGATNS